MTEPFYDREGITIYVGACEDVLPELSGVKCVVTSPPYNQLDERIPKEGTNLLKNSGWLRKLNEHGYDDTMPEAEYRQWQRDVAGLLGGCTTSDASFFYNHKVRYRDREVLHPVDLVRSFEGWHLLQEIVWDRTVAVAFNSGRFAPCDERVYWLERDGGRVQWNQEGAKFMSVWTMSPMNTGGGTHPCPFPVGLAHKCISATTDPGDLVLDPFSGSGTTLRAAKDLGRRAIGIEKERRFAEIAVRRLGQEVLF